MFQVIFYSLSDLMVGFAQKLKFFYCISIEQFRITFILNLIYHIKIQNYKKVQIKSNRRKTFNKIYMNIICILTHHQKHTLRQHVFILLNNFNYYLYINKKQILNDVFIHCFYYSIN